MVWIKRVTGLVMLAAVVGLLVWSFQPEPVLVDVATVSAGPLEVTINEDGITRIKEKYVVSTPVGGRLQRIEFQEGDELRAGTTVIATIQPSNPSLLDARTLAQANARVSAAKSAVERANSRYEQARIEHQQAELEYEDAQQLIQSNAISQTAYELAYSRFRSTAEQLKGASFDRDIAEYELELAKSALVLVTPDEQDQPATGSLEFFSIRSPIDGVVLRVLQESSTIVTPGTPIMELGDPQDLEIVVDLLSSDAVKVGPGTAVRIEQWGGDQPLQGVVRRVEPSAFLKISALGVEEQRVNVIVDFEPPDVQSGRIGDGYRVEARLVTWQSEETLKVPTSALFREQNRWAVFVLQDGRAQLTFVEIGQRNDQEAEVVSGLSAGQIVILHPGDALEDGSPAAPRETE